MGTGGHFEKISLKENLNTKKGKSVAAMNLKGLIKDISKWTIKSYK